MNSPPASEHNEHDDSIAGAEKSSHQDHSKPRPSIPQRIQQKLCETCEKLNITTGSFIVSSPATAPQQRPLRFKHGPGLGKFALRTGDHDLELPSFDTIVARALNCRLCQLIQKTIRKCTPREVDEAALTAKIRWEVDGHEEVKAEFFVNRTRRLRLYWTDSLESWAAFFIMADRTTYLAPNSEAAFRPKSNTFRAREIQPDQGKQAMIKSWLDICRREHKGACSVTTQQAEFDRLVDETYFGVIDVTDLQLKPLPRTRSRRPAKFVALSYVWGQSDKPYVTTRHNILWRRQHGGLETDLHNFPAAIRDAIKLVQKLHMRYLWVDALCIVQDSAASFRLNASEMHTIYGNAHFTICAADGKDADTGLRAMDNVVDEDAAQQDIIQVIPGLRLQIARPPEMVIKDSKWNTRGWTFQERILSRRCVVFADRRVYFQCRKAAFSEDVHNETKGSGWSFQAMGAPLRSFAEIEQRSFSFYMRCVSMFYCRDLTRPSDILAAFKGIQSVMELVMGAPFCFGLPTSHFDLALLWQTTKAVRRRVPTTRSRPSECTSTHDGRCDCKLEGDDFNGQEFPSWSWSGWIGGDIAYDPAALEGCLLTVREWLRTHTWIRYHVIDGRGKLRPLWDVTKVFEDASTEDRWKGYVGLHARRDDYLSRGAEQYDTDSEEDTDSPAGVRKPQQRKVLHYDAHGNPENLDADTGMPTQPERGYRYLQARPQMMREDRRGNSEERLQIELRGRSRAEYRRRRRSPDYRNSSDMYGQDEIIVRERFSPRPLGSVHDTWGRDMENLPAFEAYRTDHFTRSHPENPYRVRKTEWSWPDASQGFPDLAVLQFWTVLKQFRVIAISEIRGTGLTRCHVGDTADDWCGTVTVNTDWIEQHDGEMVEFIALSEAKTFTEEENSDWNYYTPRERGESEWEIYYALLVVKNDQKHVWERVGLGKIFKGAFSGCNWHEIMLG